MAIGEDDAVASIWAYLNSGYSASDIVWPYRITDTDALAYWIEPHIPAIDQIDRRDRGAELQGILLVNVFRKQPLTDSGTADAYTGIRIARTLTTLLSHGNGAVKNYASGDGLSTVGTVSFGRASVAQLGRRDSLEGLSISVPFQVT